MHIFPDDDHQGMQGVDQVVADELGGGLGGKIEVILLDPGRLHPQLFDAGQSVRQGTNQLILGVGVVNLARQRVERQHNRGRLALVSQRHDFLDDSFMSGVNAVKSTYGHDTRAET